MDSIPDRPEIYIRTVTLYVTGCYKITYLYIGSLIHSKLSFAEFYYDVKNTLLVGYFEFQ